ncbi:MAG: FAD-binding oxidoreductase [Pseudomonadota bacterium]
MMDSIIKTLRQAIGDEAILEAADIAERATSYWDSAPMRGKALALPRNTDEVATVLQTCHAAGQSVVTQGGLTNAVTAAKPNDDDVILSLEKMNRVIEIDAIGSLAVVEAGAVLQNVQDVVDEAGLRFPLDLGARGSCTIGGNIATNAGGINVLRYGMIRDLVLGLEAVLADGTVLSSMNRMLKNNAGYDLKQLFIGTEGTLGVVTRAVVRLFPRPSTRHTAFVALDDFEHVQALLVLLREQLADSLSAFEILWQDYYRFVTTVGGHRAPLSPEHPFYVVFESEGNDAALDEQRFTHVLTTAFDNGLIDDAVIPKSDNERNAIWEIRENFESILECDPVYLYDVSLPVGEMATYVDTIKGNIKARWPNGECYTMGHVADGNLHPFVCPNEPVDGKAISDALVYEPLRAIGGSVSAEHGIGMDKKDWLDQSRSDAEVALMRTLKSTLDPQGILNPGQVL